MRSRSPIALSGALSVAAFAAVCALLPGCEGCSFGTDGDGVELPPEYALGIPIEETSTACDGTTAAAVVDAVGSALSVVGGSASADVECGFVERELFTGTELGEPDAPSPRWSKIGGRGGFITDAALCMLRDLRNGPVRATAGASVIAGELRAEQEIGFVDFDPAGRRMRGYQKLRFCAPVFGCVDAHVSEFEAFATRSQGLVGPAAGDYPIETAHGLVWHTDKAAQRFDASLPPIFVATPVGPISVTPGLEYRAGVQPHMASFTGEDTLQLAAFPLDVKISDVFGRFFGAQATDDIPDELRGWTSQIAVGSRGVAEDTAAWNPPPIRFDRT